MRSRAARVVRRHAQRLHHSRRGAGPATSRPSGSTCAGPCPPSPPGPNKATPRCARSPAADVRAVLPPSGNPRSTMGAGTALHPHRAQGPQDHLHQPDRPHPDRRPRTPRPAARARRQDPRSPALAQPRLRRPDRAGHLPRPARRRAAQPAPDRPRRRSTPPRRPHASCSPNPSASASPPGSTTATGAGPTPPTRTCSSTTATPAGPRPSADAGSPCATGIPIHVMREDRILHEARATGGDVRRICDLFGLTVEGALRYLPEPDLDDPTDAETTPSSRTQGQKRPETHPQHLSSPPSTLQ